MRSIELRAIYGELILGYVTASFLIGSAVAGPAHAFIRMNGTEHNFLDLNGVHQNQLAINGAKFNRAYGPQKNGIADTDRETRVFNFNAVTPRSVILNVPQRPEAK